LPVICQALTLSQLVDRERLRIAETDSTISYFSNTELRSYTNDAVQFLSGFGVGVVKTEKITGVGGQYDYNLPSDYINFLSLIIPDYNDTIATLVYVEPLIFGKSFTGGKGGQPIPKEFTVYGDSILSVSPPYNYGGDTLYLKYIAAPRTLDTMSESCDLNYVYQLLVVDYVWAMAKAKDGEIEAYNSIMEGLIARIDLYRKTVNMRSSQPARIPEVEQ